jgi:hypothetical protein
MIDLVKLNKIMLLGLSLGIEADDHDDNDQG